MLKTNREVVDPKKRSARDERQIFWMVKMNLRQSITELMKFRNEIGPGPVLARQ